MNARSKALASSVDPKVRAYVDACLDEVVAQLGRINQQQLNQMAQLNARLAAATVPSTEANIAIRSLIEEVRATIPQTRDEVMALLKDAVANAPDDKHAAAVCALANAPVRHGGKAGT